MHEYQERSNSSPKIAAAQAYQRKIAAPQASSNGGGQEEEPLPKINRDLMYKAYQARLLQLFPSQQVQQEKESDSASPASTADVAQTTLEEPHLHGMMMSKLMQMQVAGQQTDTEATLTQADAKTEEVGQEVQAKGDWQEKADTNTVGSEPIQLKCTHCAATDSVQTPESELQQHDSNGSATEVQLAAKGEKPVESQIQQVAATGFSGSSTSLPHLNQIQHSFGVDLSGVQAYIGGGAAAACQQMGAAAYASGDQIAFKEQPSLELAAHEAAHIVQQRSGRVQLAGGVGQVGDKYENHADAVAAKVVAGKSAAPLFEEYTDVNRSSEVQEKFSSLVQSKCTYCEAGEKDKPVMRFESLGQEHTKASSTTLLNLRHETVNDAEKMFQFMSPQFQTNKDDRLDSEANGNTDSLLANRGGPTRRPASFNLINVQPLTNLGCGGFDWKVQWQVENQMPREIGFVVQKVQVHLQKTHCLSPFPFPPTTKIYWEAWPVYDDTVFQSPGVAHRFDRFYVEPAPDHYGINAVQGNAKYIPNYKEPVNWGTSVAEANGLLSTTSKPSNWSDDGTIVRHVINDFKCCGEDKISQLQTKSAAFSAEDNKKIKSGGSYRPTFEMPRIPPIGIPSLPRLPSLPRIPSIPWPRV